MELGELDDSDVNESEEDAASDTTEDSMPALCEVSDDEEDFNEAEDPDMYRFMSQEDLQGFQSLFDPSEPSDTTTEVGQERVPAAYTGDTFYKHHPVMNGEY